MKHSLLLVLCTLLLGLGACTDASPPTTSTPDNATPAAEGTLSGAFIAVEKNTSGQVTLGEANGQAYLEFSSDFQTSNGPDLHVLLDIASTPPAAYQNIASYVELGPLESERGSQRYNIPETVDVNDYQSVVIWCQAFDMVYGYAPL